MHGATLVPAALCCTEDWRVGSSCAEIVIFGHDSHLEMSVLCRRRQMTVVSGSGVRMKFSTTRRQSTVRDLSIRDGTTGWGVRDVGQNRFTLYPSISFAVSSSDVKGAKCGRVSHQEMAPSAHLSPCGFYVGFACPDLKSGCAPTENVPSWFDWVWYLVWCRASADVSLGTPISPTVYPVCYPDLHIKIPTNLGPGSASEIGHP